MKHRTLRGIAALTISSALLLAGCSGGSDDAAPSKTASASASPSASAAGAAVNANADDVKKLDAVKVSGPGGKEPKVSFDAPLSVTGPTLTVASEGDGAELKEGMRVSMNYVFYQGADASRVQSTWDKGQSPETFKLGDPQYELLNDTFIGQKVGARLVFANLSQGQDGKETTVLNVIEISDAAKPTDRTRATGTAVEPAAGLPKVTLGKDGKPSIDVPEDYKAPDKLVAQTLIKGDGPKVTADQSVTAHYTGWLLDGTQFDSSWDRGEPADFPLNGVIQGWSQGLAGQTVGSQVLLVVPPDLGYGDKAQDKIPANSTLVFVVDILDAY
ncbi:FKBP-type peptidyl-prolyl cis-trans isomerase [Cellulomonas sp. PhB143]|uniref:FKBP-type peptidyl-prolyl cis-trans isomerase n=1 Tax=Cellulomonas sp. PhB143 TaxID=2485186 RepID=UPI000F4654B6|nr:FKBP-type peptidyl-prolyl cis-trans isomerase [Cellulomonas sp. PhB143]ROS78453.1 peptidylprolyl isomerase [Cellulomonas sp. PhB143]